MGARSRREIIVKWKIKKCQPSIYLNFIWKLAWILFSLFSNKLSRCIFLSKMIVNAAEKDQIKYFVQNQLVKSFFYVQAASWVYCYCHKLCFFKFIEPYERLFHHSGNPRCLKLIPYEWSHHIRLNASSKQNKKETT